MNDYIVQQAIKTPVDYRDIGLMGNEWEIIYMGIDFSVLYDFEFRIHTGCVKASAEWVEL